MNRGRMADLVEELIGPLGAKVVGLDMLFPEPGDPLGDARLASLAEHGPLVLAHVLDMQQRSTPIRVGIPARAPLPARLLSGTWGVVPSFGFVANHAGLSQARCVGHVGVTLDTDGVMRRLAPLVQGPTGVLSTLSLAMLDCGLPGETAHAPSSVLSKVPSLQHLNTWRLPFSYGANSFVSIEAADVLSGKADPALTRGKYVLVGSSAVGLSDYVTTPLQNLTPGVLVHAEALAYLLDHGLPHTDGTERLWAVLVALVMAVTTWRLWHKHKISAWLLALGTALVWPVIALLSFSQGLYPWVLFVPTMLMGTMTALTVLEFKLIRDIKQRALVTLSQYVAAPVLKQLYALGLSSSLQPKLQDITVLVVDMRDYTRLTTEMSLGEIAQLTQDFLALITLPVLQHEGTLDRYSGDGLIAFWGAPLPQHNHADLALACAATLRQSLDQWNTTRKTNGQEAIGMRIGIESGPALVGDLGNEQRSVFTAVGTCINTASRLQELGRTLHCDLVIGPQTKARTSISLEPLALVDIKGLRIALQVYTRNTA
jgi:adenylate cyclase